MSVLLYIISNMIHVYAVYVFIDSFLGKSVLSRPLRVLTYAAYFIIGTSVWLASGEPMFKLILNIAAPMLISLQYEDFLMKKLFGAISSCAVCMLIDKAAVALLKNTVVSETGLIQGITVLLASSLFRHHQRNKNELPFRSQYSWFLIFTAAGTIAVGVLTVSEMSSHDCFIVIVLLCINFLNFYIYNMEQKEYATTSKLKMIETLNNYYRNQLYVLSSSHNKIRFLKHDFKNHINRLKELVDAGDRDEINEYLRSMESAVVEKKEYSFTGNNDIDSLMNYELSLASELDADISYEAKIPDRLNISSIDMTILLGNLLDNAVYALEQTRERRLAVSMVYNKGIIRIDIRNTFDPSHKRKYDGKEHGIGLMSVKSVLEKYHGRLITSSDGDTYNTIITMYDSAPSGDV